MCFAIFAKNSKVQNGRHFWRDKKILKITIATQQNFLKIKISTLQFLRKIQNGRHIWQDQNFLKIGMATLKRYPVGQKFHRNRSI